MITAGVLAAFLLGLLLTTTFVFLSDRRAIRREQAWWAQLAADAQAGYDRVFDWEAECREFGCHDEDATS